MSTNSWTPSDKTIAVTSYVAVIFLFMGLDYYVVENFTALVKHLLAL